MNIIQISGVTWQQQDCRLTLHYENGFTLTETKIGEDKKNRIIWHFPYEKLRMSADDGTHLIWLDFGDEGEQVINCQSVLNFYCNDSSQSN